MRVFWLECGPRHRNFGDKLTPMLLDRLGVRYTWSRPEQAQFLGIGSVLEHVADDYAGMVWTSGLIADGPPRSLPKATVVAVRGRLTLQRLRRADDESIVLGDGGLLSHVLRDAAPKRLHTIGFVPHYVDAGDAIVHRLADETPRSTIIDVCAPVEDVIDQLAACEHVISSSLHGLILADALGIPSVWMELNHGPQPVIGGGFKYRDYYSVFGMDDVQPVHLTGAETLDGLVELFDGYDRHGIDDVKAALLRSLEDVKDFAHAHAPTAEELEDAERWRERIAAVVGTIDDAIAGDERIVLIDEEQVRAHLVHRTVIPFIGQDGEYWGPPTDGAQAVLELDRLRAVGVRFVAVAWTASWWLDHYTELDRYLHSGTIVASTPDVTIFDIGG